MTSTMLLLSLESAAFIQNQEEEEEEEFIQNRTRARARFLTRWDQHAVTQGGGGGGGRGECFNQEEEEEFITSGNWRGKHNSLSQVGGGGVYLESCTRGAIPNEMRPTRCRARRRRRRRRSFFRIIHARGRDS